MASSRPPEAQERQLSFEDIDKNGDGVINRAEWAEAMQRMPQSMSQLHELPQDGMKSHVNRRQHDISMDPVDNVQRGSRIDTPEAPSPLIETPETVLTSVNRDT